MSTPATVSDASAGSSPAPSSTAAPSAQSVLDGMSADQRSKWELTGELTEPTPPADSSPAPKTDAGSSPDKPVDQAAATAASDAPASEPGKPEPKGHKGNAETRLQELLSERARDREAIARLQGQLEALTREPAKPDATSGSSPDKPPTQAEYKRYLAMPDAPNEADFENFAEFTAAMGVFIADKRWQEHQQRAAEHAAVDRVAQSVEQLGQSARERIQAATKADPEFGSKVNPQLLEIEPASVVRLKEGRVRPENVLAEAILASDHTDKLLLHFSTEDGVKEWHRLCASPSMSAFDREFGRLEGRFATSANPAPAAPTPKTLSTAPKPGTQLGQRPQEPLDPEEAALKRKDFSAYAAAANAKATAGLGAR